MSNAVPVKGLEKAKPEEILCSPPYFRPVRIYNASGMYVKVWMPEFKAYEIFCGSIDFAVPLYRDDTLDPPDKDSWTKVTVEQIPNERGPFDGMWGLYKILNKGDLN